MAEFSCPFCVENKRSYNDAAEEIIRLRDVLTRVYDLVDTFGFDVYTLETIKRLLIETLVE